MANITQIAQNARQRYVTAQQMVEESLRRAILDGTIPPGQKLNQHELAAAYGVSRVPVREALRILEAEGLVIFHPHRGAVVAGLSAEEVEELYAMRVGLEALAARLGAEGMDSEFLLKMERAHEQMRMAALSGDIDTFLHADLEFHATHYLASGRVRLWERILQLRKASQRYIRRFWRHPDGMRWTLASHQGILEACRDRDPARAVAIVREDLERTAKELIEQLRSARIW